MNEPEPAAIKVAVAVCTRNRPEMLRATLGSLARLDLAGIDCRFIVVENNDVQTVGPVVKEPAEAIGGERITLRLEPRLGIAFARNNALDAALVMDVDALAFIDDDEQADPQWLAELTRVMKQHQLDLVGGPILLEQASPSATATERMVWRGVDARGRDNEARGRRLAARGRDGRMTITTGNWLANLNFIRQSGLRFDASLEWSGGEDTDFFRALREAGGRTGWASDAIVTEHWPRERLTLSYQFRRARDQTLARQRAKFPQPTLKAVVVSLAIVLFKLVGGVVRMLQAVFDRGASLTRAARAFGAAAGVMDALRGRHSTHYKTVSGS